MNNYLKKIKLLFVLCATFFLICCNNDEIVENEDYKMSSENISKSQLLNELKSNQIIEFVSNNEYFSNSNELLKNNQTTLSNTYSPIFEKIIKPNEYITYSLRLNSYSTQTPYFRFFVINKEISGVEKAGFVKYIPSTPTYQLDVDNFSGDIEIYTVENELFAKTTFSNGTLAVNNNKNPENTTFGCINSIVIVAHPCSHGGGHLPGQTCNNGLVNDAYYEIRVISICDTIKSIVPPDNFGGTGNGGGGSTILNLLNIPPVYEGEPSFNNQSYMFFQQVYNFLQANQAYTNLVNHNYANANLLNEWLVPSIVDYFRNNGFTQENQINVINAMNMFTTFLSFESNQYTFEEMLVNKHEVFKLLMQNSEWLSSQTNQTKQSIFNYMLQNHLNDESSVFIDQIITLLTNESNIDNNVLQFVLNAKSNNMLYNSITEDFIMNNANLFDYDVNNVQMTIIPPQLVVHFTIQCAVLRANHPDWSDLRIYYEASKEMLHLTLDVFGLVPVIGEPADLINGGLYVIEGDGVNATLSFAGAVPLAGWVATGTKLGLKVVTTTTGKTKLIWKIVGNVIQFGDRGQLRKVLGLLPGNPAQAHHIIPWSSQSKMAVQRAAKYSSAFHMNEALNGIAVAAWRNQPNHNIYNNKINEKLDWFRDTNPNATPQECYNFINDLIQDIRAWVINNPNSHLNNIVLP